MNHWSCIAGMSPQGAVKRGHVVFDDVFFINQRRLTPYVDVQSVNLFTSLKKNKRNISSIRGFGWHTKTIRRTTWNKKTCRGFIEAYVCCGYISYVLLATAIWRENWRIFALRHTHHFKTNGHFVNVYLYRLLWRLLTSLNPRWRPMDRGTTLCFLLWTASQICPERLKL